MILPHAAAMERCTGFRCECFDGAHRRPMGIPLTPVPMPQTERFWDEAPRTFAPCLRSVWLMPESEEEEVSAGPTLADAERLERSHKRTLRAIARRLDHRANARKGIKVEPPFHVSLPARACTLAQEERLARSLLLERLHRLKAKPKSAVINGVRCPRVNGTWWVYARKVDESNRAWRKRLRDMVAAKKLGKELRYEEVWENWSISQQIDWLSDRLNRGGRFSSLPTDVIEDIGSSYIFRKVKSQPKVRVVRVVNRSASGWADRMLENKLRLARLAADLQELKLRQRHRRRAVVVCDPKSHKTFSLRSALERELTSYVKKNIASYPDHPLNEPIVKGEMEDAKDQAGINPEPKSDKKSNVILEDKESASTASSVPPSKVDNEYLCLAVPKKTTQISDFTDRWITIKRGQWTNQNIGQELFSMSLPEELLSNATFRNSPNYAPFRNHVYWRGNMHVNIKINANARQHGQLQISWYPLSHLDVNYKNLRRNIFNASQRSHALVTASFSNSAILKIPFSYFNPVFCISRGPKSWDDEASNYKEDNFGKLGVLQCLVLSPLTVAETTPLNVSYSVLIAFEDSHFSGLIDMSLIQGQMFSAASLLAVHHVASLIDNNRDNPTVSSTALPVLPINAGSWCIGSGMPEWTNVLRLNPKGVTPYEEGRSPRLDEMKIDFVKKIFGLIKTIHWTAQRSAGTLLWKFDAAPCMPFGSYPPIPITVGTKTNIGYSLPPVAVLANLFAWWRGSLDLRIDIVGAVELTGRLLVAYVPRYYKDITIEQAYNCPHSIFDLQSENRQFNFKIPYVADRLFWPRNRNLNGEYSNTVSPGSVYFFVYNSLIANSTIPSDCNLIVYIAGGDDFEVSVPAFPTIGTGFFPIIRQSAVTSHELIPKPGYSPVYSGSWHSCSTNQGYGSIYPSILRYGPVSDHVAQFNTVGDINSILYHVLLNKNADATMVAANKSEFVGRVLESIGGTVTENSIAFAINCSNNYFVAFHDQYGYCYVIAFQGLSRPSNSEQVSLIEDQFAKPLRNLKSIRINLEIIAKQFTVYAQKWIFKYRGEPEINIINKFQSGDGVVLQYCSTSSVVNFIPKDFILTPPVTVGEAGDQRSDAATTPSAPQDTACGRSVGAIKTFGESFYDLKDFCRRYQLYAKGDAKIKSKTNGLRLIVLKFPVMPQGLDLDTGTDRKVDQYFNRNRDGPLGIILSGYRFFCGGIRFRIAVEYTGVSKATFRTNAKVFVQHRPDVTGDASKISLRSDALVGTDDIELSGYATYHQFDSINNVISFEIPFYKPCLRTLLQRPTAEGEAPEFTSLGEVAVGISITDLSDEESHFKYEIYYKLADDARASDFIGFPPMIDLTRIAPSEVADLKRQEKQDSISSFENLEIEDVEEPKVEGQMGLADYVPLWGTASKVSAAADKIEAVDVGALNETIKESSSFIQTLKDNVTNYMPSVNAIGAKVDRYLHLIVNVITNFIHCLLNLNIKSIAVAVVSILTTIKLISVKTISTLTDVLFGLFKHENPGAPEELKEAAKGILGVAEMYEDGDSLLSEKDLEKISKDENDYHSALTATLIAGVAASFALVPRFFGSNFKSLTMLLFDGIRKFAMTANVLFVFLKNNLIVIQKIGHSLVNDSPQVKDVAFLEKEQAEIYNWACEAILITDPWKENELFTSIVKASKVYSLSVQGSLVMLKMTKLKLTQPQLTLINKLMDQLRTLRDRLAKAHIAPPVKFVPFVYELSGSTGTGKSEILNTLPYDLLKFMKLKFNGEVIYHRALGNAYWNNCHNQPVCSVDEKFPVMKTGFDDVQIAELFQLKSSCIFNPPMADIPDKNLRYNPIILQYASNNAFPQLSGIMDPDAINNRRDALVKVTIAEDAAKYYSTLQAMPYEMKRGFKNLRFQFAMNTIKDEGYERAMTWPEFKEAMCQKFSQYYTEEFCRFRARLERALCLHPDSENETFETFDQKWQAIIKQDDHNVKVEQFSIAYKKILDSYSKDKNCEARQLAVIKSLREATDYCGENNIKDETLLNKIKAFSKEVRVLKDTTHISQAAQTETILTAVTPALKADAKLDIQAETKVSENVSVDAPRAELVSLFCASLSSGIHLCPHFLLRLCQVFKEHKINYNAKLNAWRVCELQTRTIGINFNKFSNTNHFDMEIIGTSHKQLPSTRIDDKDAQHLFFGADDAYYVPNCPCDENCWWHNEHIRRFFYRDIVQACPIMTSKLQNGNFLSLKMDLPAEYFSNLEKNFTEISEERKEMQKEVGFFKNLYETLKEKLMSVDWKKWFARLAMLIGVFFFIGSLFKIWNFFCSDQPKTEDAIHSIAVAGMGASVSTRVASNLEANGFSSGDFKHGHNKRTPVSIASRMLAPPATGNMSDDILRSVKAKMRRNTFFLSMVTPAGLRVYVRAMGICGRTAVLVDHSYEGLKTFAQQNLDYEMHFIPASTKNTTALSIRFEDLKYQIFTDSSLGLLHLPSKFANFCDIRNFILPQTGHSSVSGNGMMFEIVSDNSGELHVTEFLTPFTHHGRLQVKGGQLYSDFTTTSAYRYAGFHGAGRCGSVLLAMDKTAPIAAIHVAGDSVNSGYGESIYREMFTHLNACPSSESLFGEMLPMTKQDWFVDAQVKGIGSVPNKFANRAQAKSRIAPSVIQKSPDSGFEVFTDLSVLKKNDPRIPEDQRFSPMLEGVKHHGNPLLDFNKEDLKIAVEDYKNKILAHCKPQRLQIGVLSREDAIAGIEGKEMYGPLEWNSSEGFPFSSLRPAGAHDKRWMFDFDESGRCVGYNSMLRQAMDRKWELRNKNIIPETVFIDCLKDCTVDKAKVLQPGKTRIFSISPVDFTIQQRQCTADFTAAFMANRLDLEHAIGINADSFEWSTLTLKLLNKGDSILTGDYSKFGDTIPPEIIHAFFEVVMEWYKHNAVLTPEHEQQLKIMAYEIANSTHLMFNFLYQVICGQPSGNSLTVIINSFANSIYLRLAWLHIMRNTQWCGLADLHRLVSWFSYGDDIIAALHELIRDLFNAESLHEFFAKHNLKFTNANKGTEIVPYTNLANAEFLKRGFKPHPRRGTLQVILAPLGIPSIEDTVNWISADYSDETAMTIQVCQDALRNAFGRGPEYYNAFKARLVKFWLSQGVNFISDTWEQMDFKIFDLKLNLHPYMKRPSNPPIK